jgi:amidohydrolase
VIYFVWQLVIYVDLSLTQIHSNPELAWEETIAHDTLTRFLSAQKIYNVTESAYGIKTAFEATCVSPLTSQVEGRTINFNAEYDALPGIGHACGHNLIAISSLAAFIGLSAAVREFNVAGKVQLLGTPAEEVGGGKNALLDAGAFKGVDVSLMGHPIPKPVPGGRGYDEGITGIAGMPSVAHLGLFATFHGKNAHAGMNPWDGVNALDALVCAYNNISVLRQQMRPDERVHGCVVEAPKVNNVIPDMTKLNYSVRSATMDGCRKLGDKVVACFNAAALATGCTVEISEEAMYADLRVNKTLCEQYASKASRYGERILPTSEEPFAGSTDQG